MPAYADKGLLRGILAIIPLTVDAVTGNGCKWWPDVKEVKGIE